jgi:citronellol/citronellal dehydrogenase
MSKYAMTMAVIGLSAELEKYGIACNGLWPMSAIETAAISNIVDKDGEFKTRKPSIMSDAAYVIFNQPSKYTGNFCIDEVLLRFQGAGF